MTPGSVIPLILSGGTGTRLWPLSRQTKPKQFLALGSDYSLFQDTLRRASGKLFDHRAIIVCAASHRFLVAKDLEALNVSADILLEPVARESCAAMVAGAMRAVARNPDALVLALAADHRIPDHAAFQAAVAASLADARSGYIVSFGVEPRHPATVYGYILPGEPLRDGGCRTVLRFAEKPDQSTARAFIREGYLWNSGNYLFHARTFLDEVKALAPAIFEAVQEATENALKDQGFIRLEAGAFGRAPKTSVDYAIMEKTARLAVSPVTYEWNDIGSWEAVWSVLPQDDQGNATAGRVVAVEGQNNLIHSEDALTAVVGVDDLIVVTTRDAVLVARKGQAEKVKPLVQTLKDRGFPEADADIEYYRPWGHSDLIDQGDGYKARRVIVAPGGVIALQKHQHRAEHWVVVAGEAEVTINGLSRHVVANQSLYVPAGAWHELANRGPTPLILIEIQTGEELSLDDVIRHP